MNQDQNRVEALSQAVRVSLANGGNDETTATVERANAYFAFLTTQS